MDAVIEGVSPRVVAYNSQKRATSIATRVKITPDAMLEFTEARQDYCTEELGGKLRENQS